MGLTQQNVFTSVYDKDTVSHPNNPYRAESIAPPQWANFRDIEVKPVPLAYRIFEVIFASVVLIAALPLMAIICIGIRCEGSGPIFFVRKRIGRNRKPFNFIKFRTMYPDAPERFPALYAYDYKEDELEDVLLQFDDDPRVTPFGRWLRKTSMDELPNLWHVVTGDMVLVGPRPEMMEMARYYKGPMLKKFAVRPGITGYAQIYGRGKLKFFETVNYDLQYLVDRSVRVDLAILLATVRQVLVRDCAY